MTMLLPKVRASTMTVGKEKIAATAAATVAAVPTSMPWAVVLHPISPPLIQTLMNQYTKHSSIT